MRQKCGPGTKYKLEAKVGDIIQIEGKDKDQLGRIIKLIQSHDGQYRSAQVFYKGRVSIHPLRNLRNIKSAFDNNPLQSGINTSKEHAEESSSLKEPIAKKTAGDPKINRTAFGIGRK